VDNNDYMFVGSCDRLDELISVVPRVKVVSVSGIALNCDVPVKYVNENGIAGQRCRLAHPSPPSELMKTTAVSAAAAAEAASEVLSVVL
jgi:hypothetical protein